MGKIHTRLEEHGRQGALALPEFDMPNYRQALEAAHSFMSAEDPKTGFLFSGWCQTALPHKKPKDDKDWVVETDRVSLMVEPGSVRDGPNSTRKVGVPYGSRARLILLYLQSQAVRTQSREIELGKSLRQWLTRLGVPIGGKSLKDVREQALRISRCRMTFQITSGSRVGFINQNLVDTAIFSDALEGDLLETVKLSEGFYEQLIAHSVPLQETAISAISNSSPALDIYCWLAYRLHSLDAACPITWAALHAQFGGGVEKRAHFRDGFISSLHLALAVYPEANVTVTEKGVTLRPSPPPVPARRPIARVHSLRDHR